MPAQDPIGILLEDHQMVRELLAEAMQADGSTDREDMIEQLLGALENHTTLERELMYPAIQRAMQDETQERLAYMALEEHALIDQVLAKLEREKLGTPVAAALISVLHELVTRHLEEEESELFPLARELISDSAMQELGSELAARHAALMGEELSEGGARLG